MMKQQLMVNSPIIQFQRRSIHMLFYLLILIFRLERKPQRYILYYHIPPCKEKTEVAGWREVNQERGVIIIHIHIGIFIWSFERTIENH
jgi:hypothetical protein